MQTATKPDTLVIAGTELRSRLFVGTGKYSDDATMVAALEASGCELVTVALDTGGRPIAPIPSAGF